MTLDALARSGGEDGLLLSAWGDLSTARRESMPTKRVVPGEAAAAEFELEAMPHLRSLYGTACRLTRNAADAEDLVQETCLRALRAWTSYTPGTNVRAWLYTILHRARTDTLRRKGRSPRTVELTGEGPAVRAPQEALASGHEALDRALLALPEVFRTAVVLRDVEELSYDEIACALRVPIGTVMSRIFRGRALLRRALAV